MSDSVSKFKALYFKEDLIEKNSVRVEKYFNFLEEKEHVKNHPFFEFIKNVKKDGKEYIENLFKRNELKMDDKENFYIYEQEFEIYGKKYLRKGLLCALDLKSEKHIFPHEGTFEWAVNVHKNFYELSGINFEPVLLIYKEEPINNYIKEEEELFEIKDEFGEIHRIKRCELKNEFFDLLEKTEFVIADGHHRFKAMLKSDFKKRLVLLFSVFDENLKILPTHRGVNLSENEIKNLIEKAEKLNKENFETKIKNLKNPEIIFFYKDNFYLIRGEEEFSVSYLHNKIIRDEPEKIEFYRDYKKLLNDVKNKKFNIAFFLPPITPLNVYDYAIKKLKLPPKSTDFYPKPLCGLIGLKLS